MAEEIARLQEELDRCKADKEFIWTLWKQMQGKSPALTEAISMAVERERKKNEGSLAQCQAQLAGKDAEIGTYHQVLQEKKALIATYEQRMKVMEAEVEQKVVSEQDLVQRHAEDIKKLSVQLGNLQSLCATKDKETRQHLQAVEVLLRKTGHLEEQVKQAVERKECLEGENTRLASRNLDLNSKLDSLQCMHSVLDEKLLSANNDNQALSLKLRAEEEQIAELKATLRDRDGEIQTLKEELRGTQSQYESWMSRSALQEATLRVVRIENGQLQSELAAVRAQSSDRESRSSQDITQLQSLIQQLEEEKEKTEKGLAELQEKYRILEQKVAKDEKALDVHLRSHSGASQEIQTMKELLEKTEREVFELKTLMQVKDEEMSQLRRAHEQRLKRMKNLKDSHKLLVQQLKTYETSSPQTKRPSSARGVVRRRRASGGFLRHENSDDVWNELAVARNKCLDLKKDMLLREEEHDLLLSRCLQQQTTIAELRACLQRERDSLEKKIALVHELESKVGGSASSMDQDRIVELQRAHLDARNKNIKLQGRCRELERDCHRLRQEALELQSAMMDQQHRWRAKWLGKLSKATMTDGVVRTDSATQVQLSPTASSSSGGKEGGVPFSASETETRTALAKGERDDDLLLRWKAADPATRTDHANPDLAPRDSVDSIPDMESCIVSDSCQTLEVRCATFGGGGGPAAPTGGNDYRRREAPSRKRYHSESEISAIHRQMTAALKEVQDMSDATGTTAISAGCCTEEMDEDVQLHAPSPSLSSSITATVTYTQSQPSSMPSVSTSAAARGREGVAPTASGGTVPASSLARQRPGAAVPGKTHHRRIHNCVWKKLLRSSEQRLRTLTKQVCALKAVKRSLTQTLQRSKEEQEKAIRESRTVAERLQTAKRTIQDLQAETKSLSSANRDLQSHCSVLEGVSIKVLATQQKRSEQEAENRKNQMEVQDLGKKCAELTDALKSTSGALEEKVKETAALQERICHLERDLKNKRQLIADQKRKMGSDEQSRLADRQKMVCLVQQVAELQDTLERTKHRVHSLKAQKGHYLEERQRLTETYTHYQHQLERSAKQVAVAEEDCKRKSRQLAELKKMGEQRENEWRKEQQAMLKALDDRVTEKEIQLREYQDVIIELAHVLSSVPVRISGKRHHHHSSARSRPSPAGKRCPSRNADGNDAAILRRAREIARNTFDLSDAEVDALLSGTPPTSSTPRDHKREQEGKPATLVSRIHKIVTSQPPHKERLLAEFSPSIHNLALPA